MINKEEIIETILRREYLPGSVLVRLPLPLVGSIGRILTEFEFNSVDALIGTLRQIKCAPTVYDHRADVRALLDKTVLPLPMGDAQSLVLIVRSSEPYFYSL